MKKITHIRQKLLISLAMALYIVLLYLSPISCPVLALTGIRCLGCGIGGILALIDLIKIAMGSYVVDPEKLI